MKSLFNLKNRVVYGFRIGESNLNKLHSVAESCNLQTQDLLNNIVEDYLEDRTCYNIYLEHYKDYVFTIPINLFFNSDNNLSDKFIYFNLDDWNINNQEMRKQYLESWNRELSEDNIEIKRTPKDLLDILETYHVYRLPNNLDTWSINEQTYYYEELDKHAGIEFFINVDLAFRAKDDLVFYSDCLYCFYFELKNHNITINLISYSKALKLLEEANNITETNRLKMIILELDQCQDEDELKELAEKWNTGNIVNIKDKEEEIKPYKISITDDNTILKYHDTVLNKKIEKLEREYVKISRIEELENEIDKLKKD